MKYLWLLVVIVLALGGIAGATEVNWEPYEEEELQFEVTTSELLISFDEWTLSGPTDIHFYLKDTKGNQVVVTVTEIIKLLRIINPQLVDKIWQRVRQEDMKGCPVCGSEERITTQRGYYVCVNCGNCYCSKKKSEK